MINNGFTILNVDDDLAGRYVVTRILREAGYRVEEAGSGAQALRLATAHPFSLVILDVNLPDFSGFEVCRRLKADPGTSSLPVLHLSATFVNAQAQVQGLEGGADGYLVEPLEPEVLVATVRSMLRMRQTEEALRRSEEKFRRLAESDIIGITSGKGDRIVEANGAFLRMLGYSAADTAGAPLSYSGITAPESAEADRKAQQELQARGSCAPYEKQYLRKDGSRLPALVGSAKLEEFPENTWAEFAVDLTERKKFEEQLRDAQKLESLGLLAAGIAHDFNNLLTAVIGPASLLLDQARPGSTDAGLLETILEAAERAADLTRQILAYSGKTMFFAQQLPIAETIGQVRDLMNSSLPEGVTLRTDFPDALPPIEADADQLRQILVNLVTNAGEAIAPGTGDIHLRAGHRRIEAGDAKNFAAGREAIPGEYAYIEVADTGRGMDEATQAKMFDPFFSTKFVGRGLGLAAVAGIVRSHKGAIQVESTPGAGSRVRVYLPVAGKAAKAGDSANDEARLQQ